MYVKEKDDVIVYILPVGLNVDVLFLGENWSQDIDIPFANVESHN